ncbi:MAG: hypothetical protein KDA91_18635 [Planctomycetaceae bacterium]|nr:hypothetical protein [Planctomycetaceae bacterium]
MEKIARSIWSGFKRYRDLVEWSSNRKRSKLKGRDLPGIGLELAVLSGFIVTGIGHILLSLDVI